MSTLLAARLHAASLRRNLTGNAGALELVGLLDTCLDKSLQSIAALQKTNEGSDHTPPPTADAKARP